MTYNIHPIIVHFPIALLFLYSVIKILPFSRFFPKVAWKDVERVLLFFGVMGALVAIPTGKIARQMIVPNRELVNMHQLFAYTSVWIYGALLAGEILTIFNFRIVQKIKIPQWIQKLAALAGLVAIAITGMLGGAMVYGLSADPTLPFVLKILGINL